jgi:hypothetical protein
VAGFVASDAIVIAPLEDAKEPADLKSESYPSDRRTISGNKYLQHPRFTFHTHTVQRINKLYASSLYLDLTLNSLEPELRISSCTDARSC